jgi:hypothetical protein
MRFVQTPQHMEAFTSDLPVDRNANLHMTLVSHSTIYTHNTYLYNHLVIQDADPEFPILVAICWGISSASSVATETVYETRLTPTCGERSLLEPFTCKKMGSRKASMDMKS